jgi:hypothetical protein
MTMMNRILLTISLILIFSGSLFSQTKSLADADAEIKGFANPGQFSAVYDQAKYVTRATVSFDIVEPKTPFSKQFKKFEFQIRSLFADNGIDTKPVRSTLCINTEGKRYFFASSRNLTIRLDGETINFGEADRSTEVKGRKVKENLCWEIDKELIKDFGTSANLEYEVGSIKGNLGAGKLQFFKDYATLVRVNLPETK